MMKEFKKTIWSYYKKNHRDLPWRHTTDPYKILISEVMLQQTQVSRILIKYPEFLEKFPDFESLAKSSLRNLLTVWKGIGYNRRALYLRKLSQIVIEKYNGKLSDDPDVLETLPGVGHATANSIVAYAFNKPVIFVETNIRRIFIHFFFQDRASVYDKEIIPLVEKTLDRKNPREWYWALMDYGTMLAKTVPNPNRKSKHYVIQSKFEGSARQLRGRVLHLLISYKNMSKEQMNKFLNDNRLSQVLEGLIKENFIEEKKGAFRIK